MGDNDAGDSKCPKVFSHTRHALSPGGEVNPFLRTTERLDPPPGGSRTTTIGWITTVEENKKKTEKTKKKKRKTRGKKRKNKPRNLRANGWQRKMFGPCFISRTRLSSAHCKIYTVSLPKRVARQSHKRAQHFILYPPQSLGSGPANSKILVIADFASA